MTDASPLYDRFPFRIKDCRHGAMLFLETDKYVGRSLDLYGEYCENEVDLFRQAIGPGSVVIDAGANIGAHTVFFSRAVGLSGAVHAIEPQPQIFHMLCANLALNQLMNVSVHKAFVGQAAGVSDVPILNYETPNNYGGVYAGLRLTEDYATDYLATPVISIDSLALERCDFIKLDVEGMELDALLGAEATLLRLQPILYVENDRHENSPAIVAKLKGCNFRLFRHVSPYFNPRNFFGNPENAFGNEGSESLIGLPERHHAIAMTGFEEI